MIEDLILIGGFLVIVVEVLKLVGVEVLGVVVIFIYGLKKVDDIFSNI